MSVIAFAHLMLIVSKVFGILINFIQYSGP